MPASAGIVTGVLSGAGTGIKAGAQIANGDYQAQVASNNQYIANQNADLAIFKGDQQVTQSQQRTAQTIGSERAGTGASGIDVNSASALRTQESTARIGSVDAQTIQQNAQRSAWGFQQQANMFGAQASSDKSSGSMGAIGTLIGGGADFASKWNSLKNMGA